MKFAETESTGITHRAETEGTGLGFRAETEGTGLGVRAETEGTDFWKPKGLRGRVTLISLLLGLFSGPLLANELHLYSTDHEYVKGVYTINGKTLFVEGLIKDLSIELVSESTLIDDNELKATGEGTGATSMPPVMEREAHQPLEMVREALQPQVMAQAGTPLELVKVPVDQTMNFLTTMDLMNY